MIVVTFLMSTDGTEQQHEEESNELGEFISTSCAIGMKLLNRIWALVFTWSLLIRDENVRFAART